MARMVTGIAVSLQKKIHGGRNARGRNGEPKNG
jgi:hypothetical protein